MRQPGWSAIIVNYNGASFLEPCLRALATVVAQPDEVIVVDNASTDDSLLEIQAFPRARVLDQSRNLGFAGGANAGLAQVSSEFVLLLNPDVEVAPDIGSRLLQAFSADDRIGAVGALLTFPGEQRVQHAGGVVERPLMTTRHIGYGDPDPSAYASPADVEFVTGGAMALRMSAVRQVGGFDERYGPVYYEDVDLCARLRDAGYRVVFNPELRAEHHEGVTLARSTTYYRHLHRNRIRFALARLSPREWAETFVPAEIARLRHEIATAAEQDALAVSGADAIETLLRGVEGPSGWDSTTPFPLGPDPREALDAARQKVEVAGKPLASRLPFVGRIRNAFNNLGPRWYVDPVFEQQRAFNDVVVQALDALETRQREQTAALLLIALDALGRLRPDPLAETAVPPAVSEPEW